MSERRDARADAATVRGATAWRGCAAVVCENRAVRKQGNRPPEISPHRSREAMGWGGACIFSSGIKTKLDSVDRFPIRQADTPVHKRSLYKKTGWQSPVFFFCGRSSRFHGQRTESVAGASQNRNPNSYGLASDHGFKKRHAFAAFLPNGVGHLRG